jgi:hypothetical protein
MAWPRVPRVRLAAWPLLGSGLAWLALACNASLGDSGGPAGGDDRDAARDAVPSGDVDSGSDPDASTAGDLAADPAPGDLGPDSPADASPDGADLLGDLPGDPLDEPGGLVGSGTWDDPYLIDRFPFTDRRDTSESSQREADAYACAPATNESGAEVVYQVVSDSDAILYLELDDVNGDGVDVDLHLLAAADPDSCRSRANIELYDTVTAEDGAYLVVDTWVDGGGTELPGPYQLTVERFDLPGGDCALEQAPIDLINRDQPLDLPAIGEVVREAHLVTQGEWPDNEWPTSAFDGIDPHYALSEEASGYVLDRAEPWAPAG